jgi:putative phosphoribosyl transferase
MFMDRTEAGRRLAVVIAGKQYDNPIVLALPRGGIPVALEIARALHVPMDLLLVRKVGVPFQPELAAAAIVDGARPHIVLNPPVLRAAGLDAEDLADDIEREKRELERRRTAYLKGRKRSSVKGRTAIIVDDGIATGTTVRAALEALRNEGPTRVVLAIPVAPHDALEELAHLVDEIVCLEQPEPFYAIGAHYSDFGQLSDADVAHFMDSAEADMPPHYGEGARHQDKLSAIL